MMCSQGVSAGLGAWDAVRNEETGEGNGVKRGWSVRSIGVAQGWGWGGEKKALTGVLL